MLCGRQQSELERLLKSEDLYSHDITFALYDKCFSKYRSELIRNLEDRFSRFLDEKTGRSDPSSVPDKKVLDFMRQKLIQQAVELIARKKNVKGRAAIRNAIDQGGIEFSESIVGFFEAKGGWEDIPRVVHLCENFPLLGMSLLSIVDRSDDYKMAAKALLKLGKNRTADLLSISMPVALWCAVVEAMSKASFVLFDDYRISEWLHDEVDSKRKTTALKCVICLPKSRIDRLLNSYISDGRTYYYNVVSWLDLGVSAERVRAVRIAEQALAEL